MAAKLRHKTTGDIYIYTAQLAARDDMEEFIEGEVIESKIEDAPKPKCTRAKPKTSEETPEAE